MASSPTNVTLLKGIALMGFVRNYASKQVVPFVDKETGEEYSRLVLKDQFGTPTFVNMSSNLPELHKSNEEVAAYINENKENLQVVATEGGTYILCKKGGDFKNGIDLTF